MKLMPTQYKEISDLIPTNGDLIDAESGGLIYSSSESSNQLILIETGEVRLIDSGKTFGTQTLTKLEAPALFGLSQLIKAPLNEEIRAASSCRYRTFNIVDLSEIQLSQLTKILKNALSPFELPLINKSIKNSVGGSKKIYHRLIDLEDDLCAFNPSDKTSSNEPIIYLDIERQGFLYGELLTLEICNEFFKANDWPRLWRYKSHSPHPTTPDPWDESKTAAATSSKNEEVVEKPKIITELTEDKKESLHAGFRLERGSNRLEAFVACISMLVEHFQLPTRRDTIKRAAKLLDNDNIQWLTRLLALLDSLGLAVRIVRIQSQYPLRIPTPCMWIDSVGLCSIIVNKTNKELILLNPLKGVESLGIKEATERLKGSPEVISVDIGLHTPRRKFGLHWLVPYVQRYRTQMIEVFAASLLNQIFALATPLLFQQIIDRVISKGATSALMPLIILMLIFSILETAFGSLRTFQFVEVSNRIDIGIGSAIVSRLLRLNARFFDKRPVGELSSRLGELANIRRFMTGTALTVVLDATFSVMYFSIMFFYSNILSLIVVLTIPFLFIVTVGITPITQRLIRSRAEAQSRTQSLLVEILSGIHTVKLQNAELSARRQWEDRHLHSINEGFKAILANTTSSNALQLINKLSNIVIIGAGSWLVINNEMTLGQLIAFRIISGYVTQPMMRLASSWQSFQEMSLSLERVGDVVNQPLEVSENEEGNIDMPPIKGSIKADSVGFSYSTTTAPVLSSVSLSIGAGEFVGLVGQSGCGKSSFLKMVPRLYTPTSGRIFIDDYDISKVNLYSLRQQLGFVPQDCVLFQGTIFSNIALGDPQVESQKVIEVAKIACAHEFIMGLPYGYGTPVGEKGSGLSGGQRQRISLARMLLEDPNMVILDEATSALDVDTEKQVVKNLREHFSDRTLLMITHRLSSLIEADQIVCMHAGRVDCMGSHSELMAKKGRYYALYQSQFGEPE